MKHRIAVTLALAILACSARAYVLENIVWADGNPAMLVNLSASQGKLGARVPRFPLWDGSGSFDQVFFGAIASWNSYLSNLQIQAIKGSNSNGFDPTHTFNETGFGTTSGGDSLGNGTLAVTLIYYYPGNPNTFAPTNIVFNSANFSWNSYRGPLLSVIDLRRVALHELGHFIGLDHPDQNGQVVNAIMNSVIGDTDQVTPDDIAGGQALYGPSRGTGLTCYSGDFEAAGRSDILWRNLQTGEVRIWVMNGTSIVGNVSVGTVDLGWRIAGIADFDGDGLSDILWVNPMAQKIAIWTASRSNPYQFVSHEMPALGTFWDLAGVGDLGGSGYANIIWRNHLTDQVLVTSPVLGTQRYLPNAGSDWTLVGTASVYGNSVPELIWRNPSTGQVGGWQLDGSSAMNVVQMTVFGSAIPNWKIVGFGDVNGDGKQDIFWRNAGGAVAVWVMNGFSIPHQWFPGSATLDWTVRGTGRFQGGALTDIMWSNTNNGQQVQWISNGSTLYSTLSIGTANPTWHIQP